MRSCCGIQACSAGCRDFEALSLQDYKDRGRTYGLEKFWAFHHYTGLPKGSALHVHPEVCLCFAVSSL